MTGKKPYFMPAVVITMTMIFCSLAFNSSAQVDSLPGDPGVVTAYTMQAMSFGTFSRGSTGGSIIISPSGTRSVTGGAVALSTGIAFYPAIFDIDVLYGSIVSITNGPDVTLTGSNGGSMSMHVGGSNPGSPFITTVNQPFRTHVSIGGTLTVGTLLSNPPGMYSGSFYVTFNLE